MKRAIQEVLILLYLVVAFFIMVYFLFFSLLLYSGAWEVILNDYYNDIIVLYLLPGLIVVGVLTSRYVFKCRGRKFVLISLSPAWFIIFSLLVFNSVNFYLSGFNSSKWQKYKQSRYLMITDFEQSYNIKQMTEKDITKLLGQPTFRKQNTLSYETGWGFPDPEYYHIQLKGGTVVDTYLGE